MALFGSIDTLRAQAARTDGFTTAFAYLEELMRPQSASADRIRAIAKGESRKIELAGGVFAIEQVYETKRRPEGFFESHRAYIDVQVIVEGEERIEVIDASRGKVREPYIAERDLITWVDTDGTSALCLRAGEAAIFFPVDVHMPSLRVGEQPVLVRKSVIKVPVA
jgi:biofilm protein TabA